MSDEQTQAALDYYEAIVDECVRALDEHELLDAVPDGEMPSSTLVASVQRLIQQNNKSQSMSGIDEVQRAIDIVQATEWSGDLRVITTKLSNAGRVLAKEVERLTADLDSETKWAETYLENVSTWKARAKAHAQERIALIEDNLRLEQERDEAKRKGDKLARIIAELVKQKVIGERWLEWLEEE